MGAEQSSAAAGHAAAAAQVLPQSAAEGTTAQSGSSSRFDAVRVLDEDENWRERTEVITRHDHNLNKQLARDIVEHIVDSAASTPTESSSSVSFATVSSNPPAPVLPGSLPDVVRVTAAGPQDTDSGDSAGTMPAGVAAARPAAVPPCSEYESASEQEDVPVAASAVRSDTSLLADELFGLYLQTPLKPGARLRPPPADTPQSDQQQQTLLDLSLPGCQQEQQQQSAEDLPPPPEQLIAEADAQQLSSAPAPAVSGEAEGQTSAVGPQSGLPVSVEPAGQQLETDPVTKEPILTPEEPVPVTEEPILAPKEPTLAPKEPTLAPEEPTLAPEEPTLAPEEPLPATEELVPATEELVPATEELVPATEELVPATEELVPATEELVPATEELVPATEEPPAAPEELVSAGGVEPPPAESVCDAEAVSTEARAASPPIRAASPPIRSASPPIRAASPPIRAASPPIRAASPPIRAASPPIRSASPPIRAASPPIRAASPPIRAASPPIRAASPPIRAASPPIRAASPPIRAASPPIRAASPPIRAASPPIGSASPPIRAASPPIRAASPPIRAASPPIRSASPPIRAASPPIRAASPPIRAGSPPIRAGSPPIRAGSPPIRAGSPPIRSGSPPIRAAGSNMTQAGDEDEPIPPKGGYNLDFLDDPSFNPFSTGSGIQLSPPSSPKTSLPPLKAAKTKKQREAATDAPAAAETAAAETNGVNGSEETAAEPAEQPAKPPAKKPVKKPVRPVKRPLKKKPAPPPEPAADENGRPDSPPLAPAPTKGYNLDFLENCDDPNFNPFATQSAVGNSPTGSPQAGRKVANSPPLPARAAKKSPAKPAVKATPEPEPVAEPEPEPVVEPVTEPVVEPVTEPVVKPEPEPLAEPESRLEEPAVEMGEPESRLEEPAVEMAEPESRLEEPAVEMGERPDPLGGGDASSSAWSEAGRTALLDTAPLDFGEVAGAAVTDQQMASSTNDQFVEATNFFHDPASLDRLAEHGDGRLAPNIARNSLYVKFDPLLGRPSVLPELARLAAAREEGPAPGLPRQLVSVKSDLIAFSPGKEPAEASSTPPATAAAAPASDLSSATPPTPFSAAAAAAADSNVSQLLKKQELHFQDQLLKRDREMTAMKNANAKLIQQAGNNKPEKLLERSTHLLVMLTKENGQLRRELKTRLPQLAAERDEARQEVANAEAMFADLHRKYEKSKSVLQEHRRCAEQNDGACQEARERAVREKQRYDMLQQHSEDAHSRLQADLEVAEKGHKTELLTLKAKLQLAENREAKLERENREITAICDELIQKMGGAH